MARTRSAGFDDQRDAILTEAAALFASQGFTATSMNQVAAACGVSKATLYHYVRDKHELLLCVADTHVARLEALVSEVLAETDEPRQRLAFTQEPTMRQVDIALQQLERHPAIQSLVIADVDHAHAALAELALDCIAPEPRPRRLVRGGPRCPSRAREPAQGERPPGEEAVPGRPVVVEELRHRRS